MNERGGEGFLTHAEERRLRQLLERYRGALKEIRDSAEVGSPLAKQIASLALKELSESE